MGKSWENDGKMMGTSWENDGKMMGKWEWKGMARDMGQGMTKGMGKWEWIGLFGFDDSIFPWFPFQVVWVREWIRLAHGDWMEN